MVGKHDEARSDQVLADRVQRQRAQEAQPRRALEKAGIEILPGPFFDVRDPSGNHVQIVQYDQIQFTKTDRVLAGMGLALAKSESALEELRAKDLAD